MKKEGWTLIAQKRSRRITRVTLVVSRRGAEARSLCSASQVSLRRGWESVGSVLIAAYKNGNRRQNGGDETYYSIILPVSGWSADVIVFKSLYQSIYFVEQLCHLQGKITLISHIRTEKFSNYILGHTDLP